MKCEFCDKEEGHPDSSLPAADHALRLAANFMAHGFDSREAKTLRAALAKAGYQIPTVEEFRILHGLEDFDPADWSRA